MREKQTKRQPPPKSVGCHGLGKGLMELFSKFRVGALNPSRYHENDSTGKIEQSLREVRYVTFGLFTRRAPVRDEGSFAVSILLKRSGKRKGCCA